jgi:hypothetical protein
MSKKKVVYYTDSEKNSPEIRNKHAKKKQPTHDVRLFLTKAM